MSVFALGNRQLDRESPLKSGQTNKQPLRISIYGIWIDQPAETKLQRRPAVDPFPSGMMKHRDGKQERGGCQPALT